MEECNICLTKIKKRNKNKHQQSKEHKQISNLIINKYLVKNDENEKFKDTIQSYYDMHKKKFDNFTVCVMCKNIGLVVNKISVPRVFTYHRIMMRLTITRKKMACDYLNKYNQCCMINEIDEIVIIFTSGLKDMTFSHYMAQPKSMLCRKQVRNFFEEDYGNFDYNWLPNALDI